jgi:hypothetical protein
MIAKAEFAIGRRIVGRYMGWIFHEIPGSAHLKGGAFCETSIVSLHVALHG